MTTASTGLWITDPEAYRRRLLDLVGERNPLGIMAETADAIDQIVSSHSTAQLHARPFRDKWTPCEVIGHLVDAEWTYGYRARTTLADKRPRILPMDQDRWVAEQKYNQRPPSELATAFRSLRNVNLQLWRGITPEELDRVGLHDERGEESLRQMLPMLAGHDLWHLDQINRYLQASGNR